MNKISKFIRSIDAAGYKYFCSIISGENGEKGLYVLFRLSFLSIIIIFVINIAFNDEGKFGAWGDFFGGVLNPILTFITFMGLLVTIVLQQKELREARVEFEGQKDALVQQQKEMASQSFDNKFFQMLGLLNEALIHIGGKAKFGQLKADFSGCLHARLREEAFREADEVSIFEDVFEKFNKENDTTFKYFYINLYQVINYVDVEIKDFHKAKRYTNIIRAQLTKNEIFLLFYNCIGVRRYSGCRYKELVEKYSFFEHLQPIDLYPYSGVEEWMGRLEELILNFIEEYSAKAFGKNTALLDVKKKRSFGLINH